MNIGGDARRSAVHTNLGLAYGPIPKREYHRCECGCEWDSAYKARKCSRTHELPKVVSGYGFDEITQPTPVSEANRPNCEVM